MARGNKVSRYARQIILPQFGSDGQDRLARARVLIVGAGGLAAPVLPVLAGSGIGQITIVDADTVDISNLHRQTLFSETDIGRPKVEAAVARCVELNSEITISGIAAKLTPDNAASLVTDADIILDCADSYAVSYCLSDTCLTHNTPLISASVLGFSGYVGGFCGGAPSLRAVFPNAPQSGQNCESAGVIGSMVGIIGAMQAQMALNVLLGLTPSPLGQMTNFDGTTMQSRSFRFDAAPEPEQCFRFVTTATLQAPDRIVDLRQDGAPLHPDAIRLNAHDIATHLPNPKTRLAICCATGLRAWRAAESVSEIWPGEIVLVAASAS